MRSLNLSDEWQQRREPDREFYALRPRWATADCAPGMLRVPTSPLDNSLFPNRRAPGRDEWDRTLWVRYQRPCSGFAVTLRIPACPAPPCPAQSRPAMTRGLG